jgi:hypothetical protein
LVLDLPHLEYIYVEWTKMVHYRFAKMTNNEENRKCPFLSFQIGGEIGGRFTVGGVVLA